jgi:predicted transcriptional regulator
VDDDQSIEKSELATLTAKIVSAYVANNAVAAVDLPDLISTVAGNLYQLVGAASDPVEVPKLEPAVPIKKSVTPEYIICLEDGKRLKMLKRHLQTKYNMTPDDYRQRWGLRDDYPMVAPSYAAQRSDMAKKIGLGRHPDSKQKRRSKVA